MGLYAQHGYGKSTKIEKGIAAKDISGVILSPKAEAPDKIEEYVKQLKQNGNADILFDPQFYICAFQGDLSEGKLNQYPYYYSNLTRANLSVPENIHSYVEDTAEYQCSIGLKRIISPTILFDDFNGKQSQIAVSFAYESARLADSNNEIIISFCINENAFKNTEAMNEFLDIISLLDVKGYYLIIERDNKSAKATMLNTNILTNIMRFCYVLSTLNEYEVILGYTDLLSIPLFATGITTAACGWHNSLKMFSEGSFHPTNGGKRARKRYTSNKLLNSILILPEMTAINSLGSLEKILAETQYDRLLLPSLDGTMWTDEISCLHNWDVLNGLIFEIEQQPLISDKLDHVTNKILTAQKIYRLFSGVPFEEKSSKSHLNVWLSAIGEFRNQIGE